MKKINMFITSGFMLGALAFSAAAPISATTVYAEDNPAPAAGAGPLSGPGDAVSDGVKGAGGGPVNGKALERGIKNVVNVLLYILGAIAVIMIIIGGIKYTLSNGDSAAITSAKNTILYSVIGLVVAILAFAIVNFVIDAF